LAELSSLVPPVRDLKQRGLLDDTLVIRGGELERTPFLQGKIEETKSWGCDHHPYTFTLWMTGGGVKPSLNDNGGNQFGVGVSPGIRRILREGSVTPGGPEWAFDDSRR